MNGRENIANYKLIQTFLLLFSSEFVICKIPFSTLFHRLSRLRYVYNSSL